MFTFTPQEANEAGGTAQHDGQIHGYGLPPAVR
jgi:hypothetical protein